jgi:hypothetical protein
VAAYVFTKIADMSTPIPGGSGNFTGFNSSVSISGGTAAFQGFGSGTQSGIYTGAGGPVTRIADLNTPVPGGSGNFDFFVGPSTGPSISGGIVAFNGGTSGGATQGVYIGSGGPLSRIADTSTPIPGGSGNFTGFLSPSISGGTVAFAGFGSGTQGGVYTGAGGPLTRIADTSTPIPGGSGTISVIRSELTPISGGTVAFGAAGSGTQQGVYTGSGGPLTRIADGSTPIPGGSGNFTGFAAFLSISGGTVAFGATGSGTQQGIYTGSGGPLTRIADTNTPIPGGFGNFTFLSDPSVSGGTVVFTGGGSGTQQGIYTWTGGVLSKVIASGDTLDGKTVSDALTTDDSLDGSSLALGVRFTNNTTAVYEATLVAVPEPSSLVLILTGLVLTAAAVRSRAAGGV